MSAMKWNRPTHKIRGRETERADGRDLPREFRKPPRIEPTKAELRAATAPMIEDWERKKEPK